MKMEKQYFSKPIPLKIIMSLGYIYKKYKRYSLKNSFSIP